MPSVESVSVTRRVARHVASLSAATLPSDVRAAVPTCVLDFAGCALAARTLPWSRQAAAVSRGPQGAPSTIVGTPWRAMPAEAAFASAVTGHGLVQEDMHTASGCHVGTVVIPAVLALAQAERAHGADVLAAIVAGYDAMARLGRALRDPRIGATWRPSGLAGAFGAAAACARLLRLPEDVTVSALALGVNGACGVNEWPIAGGTEIFAHAGTAARLGVTAALLAREGFVASETALDGPAGLLAALGRREHAATVADALGARWEILHVHFKPAPACNHVQTPVQVLRTMTGGARLAADDVERVVLRTNPWAIAYPGCAHAGPFDALLQAKMSIPYALAAVLLRGDVDDAAFDAFDDPALAAVARRVVLEPDDAFTAAFPARQGAEIRVRLRDGRTLHGRADDLVRPTADDVRARWRRRALAAIGAAQADAFERGADGLAGLGEVPGWVAGLAAGVGGDGRADRGG
jgi:2-methylcitrate dehydratase PrpD